jgi:hypothetical protein
MENNYKQFIRFNFYFGLALMLACLPFSKFMVSIGQWWLTGAWVLGRLDIQKIRNIYRENTRNRFYLIIVPSFFRLLFEGIGRGFREFFKNRPAMIFASIFLIHLIGLIFTVDFQYALKDLRTKIPLFILPIFLSTTEAITRKTFYRFMLLFIVSLFIVTLFNAWKVIDHDYIDIRDISRHVGNIVFGLLISLSIFASGYLLIKKGTYPGIIKILLSVILVWSVIYLVITQSMTGLSISILTILFLIPVLIFRKKNIWLKVSLTLLILIITGSVVFYLQKVVRDFYRADPVDYQKLEKLTSRGNPYKHDPFHKQTENGHYIWLYIQSEELRESWNMRSKIPFDSNDLKGQPIKFTIVRFLTSKNERKDADAVQRLSAEEIHAIERGVANELYIKKFSIRGRIYEFLMGYDNYIQTGNPTGSTVMQRLEFWKASLGLIKDNWLHGVGTGDMNIAFQQQYEKMNSKLSLDQRWRSHNQYMSVWIGFGIFGLIWFLFAVFYPPIATRRLDDYFFLVFFIIAMIAMLTDDTIESQMGVTFFSFFYCFFLFARKEKDPV